MTISAFAAAKKICDLNLNTNHGLTNLALQKILYLAHMVYMGQNGGEPLIHEVFEAWDYGPVLPSLYHKVKIFGGNQIQDIFYEIPLIKPDSKEAILLEQAYKQLSDKQPGKLVAMTHREDGAWAKYYSPGIKGIIIPNNDIQEEYKKIHDDR